jgi:hypothetical protein
VFATQQQQLNEQNIGMKGILQLLENKFMDPVENIKLSIRKIERLVENIRVKHEGHPSFSQNSGIKFSKRSNSKLLLGLCFVFLLSLTMLGTYHLFVVAQHR